MLLIGLFLIALPARGVAQVSQTMGGVLLAETDRLPGSVRAKAGKSVVFDLKRPDGAQRADHVAVRVYTDRGRSKLWVTSGPKQVEAQASGEGRYCYALSELYKGVDPRVVIYVPTEAKGIYFLAEWFLSVPLRASENPRTADFRKLAAKYRVATRGKTARGNVLATFEGKISRKSSEGFGIAEVVIEFPPATESRHVIASVESDEPFYVFSAPERRVRATKKFEATRLPDALNGRIVEIERTERSHRERVFVVSPRGSTVESFRLKFASPFRLSDSHRTSVGPRDGLLRLPAALSEASGAGKAIVSVAAQLLADVPAPPTPPKRSSSAQRRAEEEARLILAWEVAPPNSFEKADAEHKLMQLREKNRYLESVAEHEGISFEEAAMIREINLRPWGSPSREALEKELERLRQQKRFEKRYAKPARIRVEWNSIRMRTTKRRGPASMTLPRVYHMGWMCTPLTKHISKEVADLHIPGPNGVRLFYLGVDRRVDLELGGNSSAHRGFFKKAYGSSPSTPRISGLLDGWTRLESVVPSRRKTPSKTATEWKSVFKTKRAAPVPKIRVEQKFLRSYDAWYDWATTSKLLSPAPLDAKTFPKSSRNTQALWQKFQKEVSNLGKKVPGSVAYQLRESLRKAAKDAEPRRTESGELSRTSRESRRRRSGRRR